MANSRKALGFLFILLFVFVYGGLIGQSVGSNQVRDIAQLVVPPVSGAGTISQVLNPQHYTREQLAQSTPGFFEMYPVPEPTYPVQTWDLRFTSTDFDGSPVTIRAQLFVPQIQTPTELPVYVFASGTTGISDESAPSLEVPEVERWGWYRQNMLAYAAQGYVVIFPDYTGFHDPQRTQRYFSKYAEGYMMLDAIRTVQNFFQTGPGRDLPVRPSRGVFTAGYSQGGHAAMAAADLRPYYAPDLPLAGVITYGSTNDVEALMREGVAYTPLILYSYREMYGADLINPALYLQPHWIPNFDTDAQSRLPQFQSRYGFNQEPLYTPEFRRALNQRTVARDFPTLYRLMAENHTGHSGHEVPALVIQGGRDFIVTDATQTIFVEKLRLLGSNVRFLIFPQASHRYTRHAGFAPSLEWMAAQVRLLGP
ncbi:MAG: alpha/beta fold hydrolase [Spirochaetales bacterium]|nr:alpha/beta fold hydrolase [Spirochaetales bacterium]